jgi:hypothetical protein
MTATTRPPLPPIRSDTSGGVEYEVVQKHYDLIMAEARKFNRTISAKEAFDLAYERAEQESNK